MKIELTKNQSLEIKIGEQQLNLTVIADQETLMVYNGVEYYLNLGKVYDVLSQETL